MVKCRAASTDGAPQRWDNRERKAGGARVLNREFHGLNGWGQGNERHLPSAGALCFGDDGEAWHASEVLGVVRHQWHAVLQCCGCDPGVGDGHWLSAHGAADQFGPCPGELVVEAKNGEVCPQEGFQGLFAGFGPVAFKRPAIDLCHGHEGEMQPLALEVGQVGGGAAVLFEKVADDVGVKQHGERQPQRRMDGSPARNARSRAPRRILATPPRCRRPAGLRGR